MNMHRRPKNFHLLLILRYLCYERKKASFCHVTISFDSEVFFFFDTRDQRYRRLGGTVYIDGLFRGVFPTFQ